MKRNEKVSCIKKKVTLKVKRVLFTALVTLCVLGIEKTYSQTILVSNVNEFNDAVANVGPGGIIKLRNGTWEDVELGFYTNGTVSDSITLTAETPGEVVLTGRSRLNIFGEYLIVKDLDFNGGLSDGDAVISFRKSSSEVSNHSRLTNCRILDYNPASDATEYKWVSIYGANNRIDHCHFEGKNNEGALLVVWLSGSANYHQIDHNYFAHIPELGRNGGETIRIGTSTNSMTESRTIVEYNLFEACDGEIEIISNKSGFNIYRYNTFRDNEGTLTLRHGNDCEVYGNFFFGENKDSGGVRIIGERHKVYNNYFEGLDGDGFRAALCMTNGVPDSPLNRYFQVKNAEVVHNTFVSCKEPMAFGEGKSDELSLPPTDCIIANNVIDKTTGSKAITYTDDPLNFTYSSNYISGTVGIVEDGIINTDPQLVFEDEIWRLSESSPTIDNSDQLFDYVLEDIDGQERDDMPDVGSDELSTTTILNLPLTIEDVGYSWEAGDSTITSAGKVDNNPLKLLIFGDSLVVTGCSPERFPLRIRLFNLNGQLLVDSQFQKEALHLKDIPNGLFLAVVFDGSNHILLKEKVLVSIR